MLNCHPEWRLVWRASHRHERPQCGEELRYSESQRGDRVEQAAGQTGPHIEHSERDQMGPEDANLNEEFLRMSFLELAMLGKLFDQKHLGSVTLFALMWYDVREMQIIYFHLKSRD